MTDGPPQHWYHQSVEEHKCFGRSDFRFESVQLWHEITFNHSFVDVDSFKLIFKQNGDFNEVLRQNCKQKEFYSCFLAFLSHDAKGQSSSNQLKGWLKKGEVISRRTHEREKVRKVSRGRVRIVEKQ